MGIKIVQSETFLWPVKVLWPEDNEFVEYDIVCRFNRLRQDELFGGVQDIAKENPISGAMREISRAMVGGASLQESLVRRSLVEVVEGLDVPDGTDTVEIVVETPALSNAISKEYLRAISGGVVREKN